jgi:membrane protease YdiL (CAAX protease family)
MTPRPPAKTAFHVALGLGLVPFLGAFITVAFALGHLAGRAGSAGERVWSRRLGLLALADGLVLISLLLVAAFGLERLETAATAPTKPMVGLSLVPETAPGAPVVKSVHPGSPAETAGVRVLDVLLSIEGKPVSGMSDAVDRLRALEAGKPARLGLKRGEEGIDVDVVPRPWPWREAGLFEPVRTEWALGLGWGEALPLGLAVLFMLLTRRKGEPWPGPWPRFLGVYVLSGLAALAAGYAFFVAQGGQSIGAWMLSASVQAGTMLALSLPGLRGVPPGPPPALSPTRAFFIGVYYLATLLPRAGILFAAVQLAMPEGVGAPQDPLQALFESPLGELGWALLFLDVALLAPLAEEALFRGQLLPRLVLRWGQGAALGLSAALFAVMHTHYGIQAGVLVVHGAVLGWARLRSGGLQAPMALHVLVNAAVLTLARAGS